MIGVALDGIVPTVGGAICPARYCWQEDGVVWPVPAQRSDTLPAPDVLPEFGPAVLMITLLPALPVLNQSAVMTDSGQLSGLSDRVASATTVWARHCGAAVTRTQTELLLLAS